MQEKKKEPCEGKKAISEKTNAKSPEGSTSKKIRAREDLDRRA